MKFISKTAPLILIFVLLASAFSGCGTTFEAENAVDSPEVGAQFGIGSLSTGTASGDVGSDHTVEPFASDLVVTPDTDILNEAVDDTLSVSSLLFCLEDDKVLYQNNIFAKLNPASTTKILTAYTAIKYGDLDQTVTVSENALNLESGSSVAGFAVGDTIRLEDALYGLLLPSGNDAATAIAESVAGSVEAFADLMNQEARAIGATSTHYVNAHGLSADNHYTTVYDLYLMLNTALKDPTFYKVITTATYTCTYQDVDGNAKESTWNTTNYYLKGKDEPPEGVTVLGGKTGTTEEAGSCLVMFSSYNNKTYVSIVLGAPSRDILYTQMDQILQLIVT